MLSSLATRRAAIAIATTLLTSAPTAPVQAAPSLGSVETLEQIYTRWSVELSATGRAHRLAIPVGFARGLSAEFSRAGGIVTIDLETGRIEADFVRLPEVELDLWLLDNRTGEQASVAIDSGDARVRIANLKRDPAGQARVTGELPDLPDGFTIDRVIVSRRGATLERDRAVLFGAPNLFQRLYYATSDYTLADLVPRVSGAVPERDQRELLAGLIKSGARLFIHETFKGNGRTCASCHPPQNNFTLDPEFIATLPPDDPLFIHENDPGLATLENAVLLRDFAMILANADGFDDLENKFVMRGVPHTLSLANSIFNGSPDVPLQNLGWSGDGAPESGTLRDFAIGAIRQHATKSLDRIEGTDFRLPTESELDDMEAFQLSLGRPHDLETLTMTLVDPDRRGRARPVQHHGQRREAPSRPRSASSATARREP